MDRAVDRVEFHGSQHVEASLLEAETQASCSSKQVDGDRTRHTKLHRFLSIPA
jgi:hypothetical protein